MLFSALLRLTPLCKPGSPYGECMDILAQEGFIGIAQQVWDIHNEVTFGSWV